MTKTTGPSRWNIVQTSGAENQWEIEKGLTDSRVKGSQRLGIKEKERKGEEMHKNEEGIYGKLESSRDREPTLLEVCE